MAFVVRSSTWSQATSILLPDYILRVITKKGRVRNRMGSKHRMGSVQQVTINSYKHIFLLVNIFYLLKPPAPPRAVLLVNHYKDPY